MIINQSTEIGKLLGIIDTAYLRKPEARLRRENKIKTIQSSLGIEGNSLSLDQVSALFENKRVIGPAKDILEVQNAISVYKDLARFNAFQEESYLEAHEMLMKGNQHESFFINSDFWRDDFDSAFTKCQCGTYYLWNSGRAYWDLGA